VRLWRLHPQYLDAKGLTALWREGLLARAVLTGQTKDYAHHPQLEQFQKSLTPAAAIDCYLWAVHDEALRRNYSFDKNKLGQWIDCIQLSVTTGQLQYELEHLKVKLRQRAEAFYEKIKTVRSPDPHPLFRAAVGGIEPWERVSVPPTAKTTTSHQPE
jgi:hypothetical protein